MRLLMLGPLETPTYYGGVATVVEELSRALSNNGVIVEIATLAYDSNHCGNIPVFAAHSPLTGLRRCNPAHWVSLWQQVSSRTYEVIVTHLAYGLLLKAAHSHAQRIHFIHGFKGHEGLTAVGRVKAHLVNSTNAYLAKQAHLPISNSYLTRNVYQTVYGVHSLVLPLGVTSYGTGGDETTSIGRRHDILYVGKLSRVKQVDVLLRAFESLIDEIAPDIILRIIGDGPQATQLHTLADQLGIRDRVAFHGRVDRRELPRYYKQAACFVSLRVAEPFGLTYLEALNHGCPIVLIRGSGFSDFFEDWMGVRVERDSVRSVAGAIGKCLSKRWDHTFIAGQARATFSWDNTARQLIEILSSQEHNT